MGSLAIVSPINVVASSGNSTTGTPLPNTDRAFSPDPKEALTIPAVTQDTVFYVLANFGNVFFFDSVFIGYHTAPANVVFGAEVVQPDGSTVVSTPISSMPIRAPGYAPPQHGFYRTAQPAQAGYVRIGFLQKANNPPFTIGVIAIGLAFQPTYGTEYGAGRFVEDTGSVERLFGGGFGLDDGAGTGGYSWTFGDLQPAELRTLYQLLKDRRTTRPVLVVEDPAQTDGLNERLHWGLFTKLEPYERLDALNTKIAMTVQDWG